MMWTAWVGLVEGKEGKPSLNSGVPTFQLRNYRHPSPVTPVRLKKKKNFFFFSNSLGLSSFPISSSIVHLEANRMDPAFRVEFKYIRIILHDYCVIIKVVVVPQEGSTSSPSFGALGRFWALRALSRGALGSARARVSRPPSPSLTFLPAPLLFGSSSTPPPRSPRAEPS